MGDCDKNVEDGDGRCSLTNLRAGPSESSSLAGQRVLGLPWVESVWLREACWGYEIIFIYKFINIYLVSIFTLVFWASGPMCELIAVWVVPARFCSEDSTRGFKKLGWLGHRDGGPWLCRCGRRAWWWRLGREQWWLVLRERRSLVLVELV